MTPTRLLAAIALCLSSATLARAEDFPGRYALEGRDSLSRAVKATLRVTTKAGALTVERDWVVQDVVEGVPTANAGAWRSTTARLASPRALRVTYRLPVRAEPRSRGLVAALDPDAPTEETVAALEHENVLEAVYFLSADGRSLREVLLNTTRLAPERWRTLEAQGPRVFSTTDALPAAQLRSAVERHARAWYVRYTEATYSALLAGATSSGRTELLALRTKDRDFDETCALNEGDRDWSRRVDDTYAAGHAYRDGNGAVVPRATVKIFWLSMVPKHAAFDLKKFFVVDGRTGDVLDESEVE